MRVFIFTEIIDNIAYIIYNFFAIIKFYIFAQFKYRGYFKKNKKLKNKHRGESCYIVLNGPSISKHDLTKLKDKFTFCTNYFHLTEYCDQINPNYYCIIDSNAFQDSRMHLIHDIANKCPDATFLFHEAAISKTPDNIKNKTHYIFGKHMPNMLKIRENLAGFCSAFTNISCFCIMSAVYMGFKKIYILGNDFAPGNLTHAYNSLDLEKKIHENAYFNKYKSKRDTCCFHFEYYLAHIQSFYIAKFASKKGSQIFNLNSESYIRAYDFIDYKKAINNEG